MIGAIKIIPQIYKPWKINDNDIISKGIQSWALRGINESRLIERSSLRDARENTLFEYYISSNKAEGVEFNKILDALA